MGLGSATDSAEPFFVERRPAPDEHPDTPEVPPGHDNRLDLRTAFRE